MKTIDASGQVKKLELLGRLAVKIAHDSRNQLAKMRMGVDYFFNAPEKPSEETVVILECMNEALERIDVILKELLDLSVSPEPEMKPEDLHSVIDQSLSFIGHELEAHKIQLVREFDETMPLVPLDRGKIKHALANAILSIVPTLPPEATLTVKTCSQKMETPGGRVGYRKDDVFRPGDCVAVIELEDPGGGIPRDFIDKISDSFFTTKKPVSGSELGLAIAANILDLHGGTVDLEEGVKEGAKVVLRLKIQKKVDF